MHAQPFRKKPVVIEAIQLDSLENPKDVCAWIQRSAPGIASYGEEGQVYIETLEGVMRADDGDWIIRGVQGEFYPCKPAIFDATYERESGL